MPSVLVGRMVFVHFLGSRGVQHGNAATYHVSSLVCLSTVSSLYQRRDKYQRQEDTTMTKLCECSDIAWGIERKEERKRRKERKHACEKERQRKPLIGLETRWFLFRQIYFLQEKLTYGSIHAVTWRNVCPHLEIQRQLLERYYIALSPELKQ